MFSKKSRVFICAALIIATLTIGYVFKKTILEKVKRTIVNINTPTYTYQIINKWPHDPKAYTQGLEFYNGFLYESTGLKGKSSLRKVDLETGKIVNSYNLAKEHFAEGMTLLNGNLWQLTWRSNIGFIYDPQTLSLLNEFNYSSEGWGLTNDGNHLIMSDGTNILHFINPNNFKTERVLKVRHNGVSIQKINELEFINNEIFANIFQTDRIARIDPSNGKIKGWIDLSGLGPASTEKNREAVLNGIAYDIKRDRLFVTGKNWPSLYEIELKIID